MPYRVDLKRPDLKGTFRCSICMKIFCHSSSLSRHRMQAHFKSYTCTLCNKEITSNETLRAHMYKQHQISRMFMCRCCNWAFPDKTSLHIHMQSTSAGGAPVNVGLIAKSGPSAVSPHNPAADVSAAPSLGSPHGIAFSPPISMVPPGLPGGIFPAMPQASRDELMAKLRARVLMNGATAAAAQQQIWPSGVNLAAWLSNFPRVDASGVASLGGSLNLSQEHETNAEESAAQMQSENVEMHHSSNGDHRAESTDGNQSADETFVDIDDSEANSELFQHSPLGSDEQIKMEPDSSKDCGNDNLVIDEGDGPKAEDMKQEDGGSSLDLPALRSAISASPLNSLLYKKKLDSALRKRNLENYLRAASELQAQNLQNLLAAAAANQQAAAGGFLQQHQQQQQHSACLGVGEGRPTSAASSHASPTDSNSSATPPAPLARVVGADGYSAIGCYECHVAKGRLTLAENKNRFLDGKIANLKNEMGRQKSRLASVEANTRHYEHESRELRQQNELLQRKLLECQEKTLAFLQHPDVPSQHGTQKFLTEILQTTFLG